MADYVRPLNRKSPCRLGEKPVKADHHPDLRLSDVVDGKGDVSGRKKYLFIAEKMRLPVQSYKTPRACKHGGVVSFSSVFFGYAKNDEKFFPAGGFNEPSGCIAVRHLFRQTETLFF